MDSDRDAVFRCKGAIRAEARDRRRRQPDQAALSRRIGDALLALPEYLAAAAVMLYVDVGSEVRTRPLFAPMWAAGKQVVVPYCVGDGLELFRLESLEELAPGTLGIPEPAKELRGRGDRAFDPAQLDLVVVPGIAFDRRGGRLGQGKGYYDRFLPLVSPRAALVGLAFECQLLPEIPMLQHDLYLHKVITEAAVYVG
jgi:5-formyltetrahydrofolate cyclo-ligase